nr:hypothetical protein [Paenibacillus andongensis]
MHKVSHYPSFDVMNEQDEWDDHTQSIVTSRLYSEISSHFLTASESMVRNRLRWSCLSKGICTYGARTIGSMGGSA